MVNVILWVVIAIIVIILLWLMIAYNLLVTFRNRIENAWSQIDVQLKRRTDLIPNLVETVKGYAKHEKSTFEMVTKARTLMLSGNIKDKAKGDNMFTSALKSIFAVAEAYPKLQASDNFKMLQEELSGTESKIAYARQAYNDNVLNLNTAIQRFPTNIISGMFGFISKEYFKVEEADKKPVKVKFE
ncbi:MAG TPA: LemA family protein [Candidatus Nanoarchaeia archaeon]|nr:LemA family protein [Candidatus Nanoarchaeia archaeon]